MGILNLTPDSFSDGGEFLAPEAALTHALEMLDDGADLLDLGGESTRPNASPVTPDAEQARVLPVLSAILKARPGAVLSIDTYHAETARRAVEDGAEIVNDVSGHQWDPAMSGTCASLACGAILMHTRGRPQTWRSLPPLAPEDVVSMVLSELRERAAQAMAAGVEPGRIVLDPGFGFGKAFDENYPLLAGLGELHALGFPILAGMSRKGFLRRTVEATLPLPGRVPQVSPLRPGNAPSDFPATTAANTAAILGGAHILRVHDVRPARAAAAIADRILQAAKP